MSQETYRTRHRQIQNALGEIEKREHPPWTVEEGDSGPGVQQGVC